MIDLNALEIAPRDISSYLVGTSFAAPLREATYAEVGQLPESAGPRQRMAHWQNATTAWVVAWSSRQGNLLFKVDASDPTAPVVPGIIANPDGSFDYPTGPSRLFGPCLYGVTGDTGFEIYGDAAFLLTCEARQQNCPTCGDYDRQTLEKWDVTGEVAMQLAVGPEVAGWEQFLLRPPPPVRQQAERLLDLVQELADLLGQPRLASARRPRRGSIQSLIQKVERAIAALARENYSAASGKFGAFVNEVEAMIRSGQLTGEAEQKGHRLIAKAQSIINQLDL